MRIEMFALNEVPADPPVLMRCQPILQENERELETIWMRCQPILQFSFEAKDEVTRSAAWKGFIEGELNDRVTYDLKNPGPVPPGFEAGVSQPPA